MPRALSLGLIPLLITILIGCGGGAESEDTSRRSVVAAIYPLEFLAINIAGTEADVAGVTPAGVQPHNLTLTSAQVRSIQEADLLIYLGRGFQPAVEEQAAQVERKLDVLTLESTPLLPADPHVWLDPAFMVRITTEIARSLGEADPDNADFYEGNAQSLVGRLNELDDRYSNGLARCATRQIVTRHAAFGYLAERFNLVQEGIAGIDPGPEPGPGRVDDVGRLVDRAGVTTVFVEPLLEDGPAEAVAEATGTATAVLDPLESAPASGDYFSVMQANLSTLRTALRCR